MESTWFLFFSYHNDARSNKRQIIQYVLNTENILVGEFVC